ncbi:hypothetical protein AK812_SmicGene35829 [Symbiodinium microadriaticum]|uniref:Uncharacterized protein n=1 Tax=Symbiodinium microadriaticum TaxID=2951 RepID=A0A1Q9CKI2_SYMMI|nr:hypothetical protein AK812_SmicGene35829 [Symbiodinium microadriaticum]
MHVSLTPLMLGLLLDPTARNAAMMIMQPSWGHSGHTALAEDIQSLFGQITTLDEDELDASEEESTLVDERAGASAM